jgi:hypothetical protein
LPLWPQWPARRATSRVVRPRPAGHSTRNASFQNQKSMLDTYSRRKPGGTTTYCCIFFTICPHCRRLVFCALRIQAPDHHRGCINLQTVVMGVGPSAGSSAMLPSLDISYFVHSTHLPPPSGFGKVGAEVRLNKVQDSGDPEWPGSSDARWYASMSRPGLRTPIREIQSLLSSHDKMRPQLIPLATNDSISSFCIGAFVGSLLRRH